MARKRTLIREWRASIIREKIQYLGRVLAPDKEAAIEGDGGIQDRTRAPLPPDC